MILCDDLHEESGSEARRCCCWRRWRRGDDTDAEHCDLWVLAAASSCPFTKTLHLPAAQTSRRCTVDWLTDSALDFFDTVLGTLLSTTHTHTHTTQHTTFATWRPRRQQFLEQPGSLYRSQMWITLHYWISGSSLAFDGIFWADWHCDTQDKESVFASIQAVASPTDITSHR